MAVTSLMSAPPPLLKIRTITAGLTLSRGEAAEARAAAIATAAGFVSAAAERFTAAGFEVQTTRLAANSFEEWCDVTDAASSLAVLRAVDAQLVELGVGLFNAGQATSAAALALVPLVEVAWADGNMDRRERRAVLSAASDAGLQESGTAYQLLEGWLGTRPRPTLLETWKEYVSGLVEEMTADTRFALMDQILGRARAVAEAAGGFLGMGSKVSTEEQAMLDQLEQAFR